MDGVKPVATGRAADSLECAPSGAHQCLKGTVDPIA